MVRLISFFTSPPNVTRIASPSRVFLSQGLNYIVMGHIDQQGQGVLSPQSFVTAFKTKKPRDLAVLNNVRCWW